MLGEKSEKLTGADISRTVEDALMAPVRDLMDVTHFRKVSICVYFIL